MAMAQATDQALGQFTDQVHAQAKAEDNYE